MTEANIVIPEESDYVDFGEDTEEVDVASLWENIRKKKQREGKNYRPAKPGDKDRPTPEALKKATEEKKVSELAPRARETSPSLTVIRGRKPLPKKSWLPFGPAARMARKNKPRVTQVMKVVTKEMFGGLS